jgi:hypothetical protein
VEREAFRYSSQNSLKLVTHIMSNRSKYADAEIFELFRDMHTCQTMK